MARIVWACWDGGGNLTPMQRASRAGVPSSTGCQISTCCGANATSSTSTPCEHSTDDLTRPPGPSSTARPCRTTSRQRRAAVGHRRPHPDRAAQLQHLARATQRRHAPACSRCPRPAPRARRGHHRRHRRPHRPPRRTPTSYPSPTTTSSWTAQRSSSATVDTAPRCERSATACRLVGIPAEGADQVPIIKLTDQWGAGRALSIDPGR
jgi:hypothetical protein